MTSANWPMPANPRSRKSFQKFLDRLEELGATLLEEGWLGALTKHRLVCAQGHECAPLPSSVMRGNGPCGACAGNDSKTCESEFRARLAELGATLLEDKWLGARAAHRVRCSNGHDCAPWPTQVQQGGGICKACAGNDPQQAEAAFRTCLEELGATLLEPHWLGASNPHRVRCPQGHACTPRPSGVISGRRSICRTCAGNDPKEAEAKFRNRLGEMGATFAEQSWLGALSPHKIICAEGHECAPTPANVHNGQGICRTCSTGSADVFYIASSADAVKFGITSGDPRPRLGAHRRDGFTSVVRVWSDMPHAVASELESELIKLMRAACVAPVRGREYYPIGALPMIRYVAEDWLSEHSNAPERDLVEDAA